MKVGKGWWKELPRWLGRAEARSDILDVDGIEVNVVRKAIRNVHLRVYPPQGNVKVAAPFGFSDHAVRRMVAEKLEWIRHHQARLKSEPRPSKPEFTSGESHYFLGDPYCLRVVESRKNGGRIELRDQAFLDLHVRSSSGAAGRERAMQKWYREQLGLLIPPLIRKWESVLGVKAAAWGIKKMKTRWGSCNTRSARIWLNLELAKKPVHCLEYVVVHELVHLLERRHNKRFHALMDRHFPQGREIRAELDRAPSQRSRKSGAL